MIVLLYSALVRNTASVMGITLKAEYGETKEDPEAREKNNEKTGIQNV